MTALAYYVGLGFILVFTHGHYAEPYVLALVAVHTAFIVRELARGDVGPPAGLEELLAATLFLFSLFLAYSDQLIYPAGAAYQQQLKGLLRFLPMVAAALFVALRYREKKAGRVAALALLAGAAGLLVAVRWLTLWASPTPHIDVWTSSVAAVKYFLQGLNPYTQQYTDIYAGAYDYIPSFPYLPGYLYWATAFAGVFRGGHDVRVSLVAAELLTAGVLVFLLRALRVELLAALLGAVAWLAFPIDLFVLEQAWIDPLLVLGFALAAWALAKQKWALAGVAFGFACGVKQYAAPGVLLALPYVWRLGGRRGLARFAVGGVATVVGLFAPFLVASPERFVKYTLFSWADALPRLDSLAASAWLAHTFATKTPDGLTSFYRAFTPVTLLALGLCGYWVWRRPPTMRQYLAATAACYGVVLLFAKQSFCNYWYFMSFFVFAAAFAPADPPEPAARAQPAAPPPA